MGNVHDLRAKGGRLSFKPGRLRSIAPIVYVRNEYTGGLRLSMYFRILWIKQESPSRREVIRALRRWIAHMHVAWVCVPHCHPVSLALRQ